MTERYVVRDQARRFYAEFTSAADRFDPSGETARERALGWAGLQSLENDPLMVFREDSVPPGQSIVSIPVHA